MQHFIFQLPNAALASKFFMNRSRIFRPIALYEPKHVVAVMVEKSVHIKMREIYLVPAVLWILEGFLYFGLQGMGYAFIGVQK